MSKKSLIICICAVLALLGLIGFGVRSLYHGGSDDRQLDEVSHAGLLRAVPSDAAAVFCFQNAKDGVRIFSDASHCIGALLSGNDSFRKFVSNLALSGEMKSVPMAVSLHFARTLEPLMVIDCGRPASDTTEFQHKIMEFASESGLQSYLASSEELSYILVSGAETVVDASRRHISEGVSLLDDAAFSKMAGRMPYKNVLFICNGYASKITAPFFKPKYQKHCSFLKKLSDWTAFSIDEDTVKLLTMNGQAVYGQSPSFYFGLMDTQAAGELRFQQTAPQATVFAFSLAVPDPAAWQKSYCDYLDASVALEKYRRACDTLFARTGCDPAKWAVSNNVREVAYIYWRSDDGKMYSADFIRFAKARGGDKDEARENELRGLIPVLFGDIFSLEDDSYSARHEDWMVCGSFDAVSDFLSSEVSLSDRSDAFGRDVIITRNVHFSAYFSAGDAEPVYNDIFRPALMEDLAAAVSTSSWAPMALSYTKDGLVLNSARVLDAELVKSKAKSRNNPAGKVKMKVEVPSGPFQVTNCATGKTNLFYQSDNLFLCLKDEASGKGLWGVPFDTPICGKVECIDYLANGKLQFLFAAGSKLYLIDRLGRFVSGFPVELGKDVLIGPAAYDFSGAKGYTVMVLHKDNTIEMYDIHGYKPAQWKGIASEDTILGLPVLAKSDDRKCWVVTTSAGETVYDFWGGEPLKKKEIKNIQY